MAEKDVFVKIKLEGPEYKINKTEAEKIGLVTTKRRITAQLLQAAVSAKYPQGLDGKDSRVWGRVLDQLTEGADNAEELTLTRGEFRWLHNIVTDDDLKLGASIAHWRVALADYMDDVKHEQKEAEKVVDVN